MSVSNVIRKIHFLQRLCGQPEELDKQADVQFAFEEEAFGVEDEEGSPEEAVEEDVVDGGVDDETGKDVDDAEDSPQLLLVFLFEKEKDPGTGRKGGQAGHAWIWADSNIRTMAFKIK